MAKVGDEPAVTKGQPSVTFDGMVLSDNPGIMWPKVEATDALIHDFRQGAVGRITLEASPSKRPPQRAPEDH